MIDEEVNKIIADFMWSDCDSWDYGFIDGDVVVNYDIGLKLKINYTKSLDALVPVWEKMPPRFRDGIFLNFTNNIAHFELMNIGTPIMATIQQAAAHATAKAILELNDD